MPDATPSATVHSLASYRTEEGSCHPLTSTPPPAPRSASSGPADRGSAGRSGRRRHLGQDPRLDPAAIGDGVWGNATGAGDENRNVARMALSLAGRAVSIPATTMNRLCGSSLVAVMISSRTIETGDADIALTDGGKSMTFGLLAAKLQTRMDIELHRLENAQAAPNSDAPGQQSTFAPTLDERNQL